MAAADVATKLAAARTALDNLADELEDYSDNNVQGHCWRNKMAKTVRKCEDMLAPRAGLAETLHLSYDWDEVAVAVDAANPS